VPTFQILARIIYGFYDSLIPQYMFPEDIISKILESRNLKTPNGSAPYSYKINESEFHRL